MRGLPLVASPPHVVASSARLSGAALRVARVRVRPFFVALANRCRRMI
jgi:hypothetical protein